MGTQAQVLTTTTTATWTFPVFNARVESEFLVVAFMVILMASAAFGLQNILLHLASILRWAADAVSAVAKAVHEFQVSGYKNHGKTPRNQRPMPGKPIHFGPLGRMWENVTAKWRTREEED
jgi:hypothetical protein